MTSSPTSFIPPDLAPAAPVSVQTLEPPLAITPDPPAEVEAEAEAEASSASSSQPINPDMHALRHPSQSHSREATPSSPSNASSPQSQLDSVGGSLSQTLSASGSHDDDLDMNDFLKKMEMEKKIHALQQRLELASVKATNGWKDMSMNEIENKLPATPLRTRKAQLSLLPTSPIGAPTPSSSVPYEPPSPSRPWQLIDVLWQPLPPPSHGRYPASPSSPKKRSRADDAEEQPEPPRPQMNGYGFPPAQHRAYPSPKQSGHRRSSSSASTSATPGQMYDRQMFAGPSSPLRPHFEDGKKKRSQSHSTHHRTKKDQLTTSQDVDAAKALTSMLGSGSEDGSMSRRNSQLSAPLLPAMGTSSLPIPERSSVSASASASLSPTSRPRAFSNHSTSTPRPVDLRTPNSHARSHVPGPASSPSELDREDKDAAELMMFLAHSPSPMKSTRASHGGGRRDEDISPFSAHASSTFGSAARVLFADDNDHDPDIKIASALPTLTSTRLPPRSRSPAAQPTHPHPHPHPHPLNTSFAPSNLAVAPPITPK